MSVLSKRKKSALGEITMASTSDVAFLLLIFFIVSTVFAAEQGLVVILPAKEKESTTVRVKQSNIAAVTIHADNAITVDGKPLRLENVKNTISDRILNNPKLVVVLETHPDADYGMMVAVLDELKLANARKLTLKTTKVEG
ncbi:MAG: biopolymer transporter ExbD [Candidatus Krumholzibacteriia bacterium]